MKCRNIFASLPSANATRLQNRQFEACCCSCGRGADVCRPKKEVTPCCIQLQFSFCSVTKLIVKVRKRAAKRKRKTKQEKQYLIIY